MINQILKKFNQSAWPLRCDSHFYIKKVNINWYEIFVQLFVIRKITSGHLDKTNCHMFTEFIQYSEFFGLVYRFLFFFWKGKKNALIQQNTCWTWRKSCKQKKNHLSWKSLYIHFNRDFPNDLIKILKCYFIVPCSKSDKRNEQTHIVYYSLKSTKIYTICWQTHLCENDEWFWIFVFYRTCCSKQSMSNFFDTIWFYNNFVATLSMYNICYTNTIYQFLEHANEIVKHKSSDYVRYEFGHWILLNLNRILNVSWSSWTHFKWFFNRCTLSSNISQLICSRRLKIFPYLSRTPVSCNNDSAERLSQCVCYWFY